MAKVQKSQAQIEYDKREAAELSARVLKATSFIPQKVQEGSYQTAVAFKQHATKARAMAVKSPENVVKMREAWNLLSGYYSKQEIK